MKRDRELMGEIAARRTVVHERMPTVDREKFKRRFKEEDKEEFDTLFDMPDEEDVKESFQKIIDEGQNFYFIFNITNLFVMLIILHFNESDKSTNFLVVIDR